MASQDTLPPPSTQTKPSRLKRRAGGTQASAFDFFDTTPRETQFGGTIKEETETPAEIRALYEESKRSSRADTAGAGKKARVVSDETGLIVEEDERGMQATNNAAAAGGGGGATQHGDVDVDMDVDEEDFVKKTLRSAAATRIGQRGRKEQEVMPPPPVPAPAAARQHRTSTRPRSTSDDEDEEEEQVEPKRPRLAGPARGGKGGKHAKHGADVNMEDGDSEEEEEAVERVENVPTQDTAFLQAISKARSKKSMDEMDKEFNNLRIPKPAVGKKGAAATKAGAEAQGDNGGNGNGNNRWEGPDYSVLNDFHDEMRGNFIQVVKMDLFRKDGGKKVRVEEEQGGGKPNYKKFKKVTQKPSYLPQPIMTGLPCCCPHSCPLCLIGF